MHGRDGHVLLNELVTEFFDSLLGIAVDNSLSDFNIIVQFDKCIKFPFFTVQSNIELLDTIESEIIVLDENSCRVSHELLGDFENFWSHSSREKCDLNIMGELLEDFIDLILETTSEHLISLIEDEELEIFSGEESLLDHFEDTSGSSDDDLDTFSESLFIFLRVGTTCASISGDLQVLTEVKDNCDGLLCKFSSGCKDKSLGVGGRCVDSLEGTDREGSCLTST